MRLQGIIMAHVKAIILAGGRGERLKPLTDKIPKPMVKVNGLPILHHIINLLRDNGITEFIIALCYKPKIIQDYLENGSKFGVNITYICDPADQPLGTAGSIANAKELIDDTFIVTYADILRDLDIKEMLKTHKKNKGLATINVYKRPSNGAKSLVLFNKNKKMSNFIERPKSVKTKSVWSNGSFYIFEKEIFDYIPLRTKLDFGKDVFPEVLAKNKDLYVFQSNGYFIDIGDLKKLDRARRTFNRS